MQGLVGQHLAAREALLAAGAVAQLLQLLDGPQDARRAKFDCVMLLSDLLESALAADAALASKCAVCTRPFDKVSHLISQPRSENTCSSHRAHVETVDPSSPSLKTSTLQLVTSNLLNNSEDI